VNGDGKPDLLVANEIDSTIGILPGNGDGTFGPQQTLATGAQPDFIAIADPDADGRPDLAVANAASGTVSVFRASPPAAFIGQTYTEQAASDIITGTSGIDQITLTQDTDHTHIDWTLGTATGKVLIADPNGLTINGVGDADVVTLDNTAGNPIPDTLHLNGTFTINNLQGPDPLSGRTLDIGRGTLYITYAPGQSPVSAIQQYLKNGYNNGAWNGVATGSTGAITSSAAQSISTNPLGVGYADSADNAVTGLPANTIELRLTLMGDANLDGVVDLNDALLMTRNWNAANSPAWDYGNFNYDATINLADAAILQKNWNAVLSAPVTPGAVGTNGAAASVLAASSVAGGSTDAGTGGGTGATASPGDSTQVDSGKKKKHPDRKDPGPKPASLIDDHRRRSAR
jgi:hypothetical protein